MTLSLIAYLEDAREYCFVTLACLAITLALLHILCEVIEQVINDLCREDLDIVLFCELLSIWHDLNIERQQASILLVHTR